MPRIWVAWWKQPAAAPLQSCRQVWRKTLLQICKDTGHGFDPVEAACMAQVVWAHLFVDMISISQLHWLIFLHAWWCRYRWIFGRPQLWCIYQMGEWGAETGVKVGVPQVVVTKWWAAARPSMRQAWWKKSISYENIYNKRWPLSQFHQLWVQGQNQGNACYFIINLFVVVSLEATIVKEIWT
jgi:hypothetical protein